MKQAYESARRWILSSLKHFLLPKRLELALRHCAAPVVVEVGANDGKTGDPLHHLIRSNRRSKALLIEPIPYLFERLQSTYSSSPHCVLANVAIAPASGTMPIYFIDPEARDYFPELPSYFEELASFDIGKITSVLGDRGASLLRERIVRTLPLRALLAETSITNVDLLQIDTEGYDYEVLKTFPFDLSLPVLVCFEHSHLSESDRAAAISLMIRHGYSVEKWGKDFVCVRKSRLPVRSR